MKSPAIFYSPHADDEALGMAGAIREHKEAGRPVYLVLLTNGINSLMLNILNGNEFCHWHKVYHHFDLTMEQMMWGRKVEFVASARCLGVDKVFIVDDGQGLDDCEPYEDYDRFVGKVVDIICRFEERFPGSSHKLVSGYYDVFPDGSTNPTHQACWDAAKRLCKKITDFRFYRIYVYWKPVEDRTSQFQLNLKPEWQFAKKAALKQYRLFNPLAGRYAIGYHSVADLIEEAYTSDKEYIDLLP
jgi:LmbE family N-acetylglucosaminyl deacetylase